MGRNERRDCLWVYVLFGGVCACGPSSDGETNPSEASSSSSAHADGPTGDDTAATSGSASASVEEGTSSDTPSTTAPPPVGWIEPGWGYTEFNAFEDGASLPVVFGPQGAYMFTLALQGGGFETPVDPAFDDPDLPVLGVDIQVEGTEGPMGPLVYLRNYTVPFQTVEPDRYEYVSVWMTLPESIDPMTIEGRGLELHVELDTADGQHLEVDRTGTVGAIMFP